MRHVGRIIVLQDRPPVLCETSVMQLIVGRRLCALALSSCAVFGPSQLSPASAWCGAPFPPYAYSMPWFEFPVADGAANMRVVGDSRPEQAKKLSPLLVLPPVGLTNELFETLEALTISERRVGFVNLKPGTREAVAAQAIAALDALEAPKAHILAHSTAAAAALAVQAARPSGTASIILASPLASLDDAASEQRDALMRSGPAPLFAISPSYATAPRACVDAELKTLISRPAAELKAIQATLSDASLPALSSAGAEAAGGDASGSGAGTGAGTSEQVDLLQRASASGVPLLVTRGSADVSGEATARRLVQRVPGARVVTFDGSGALAHVEQRSAYNAAILDFLDGVDGVASRRAIMLPGSMKPGGSIRD